MEWTTSLSASAGIFGFNAGTYKCFGIIKLEIISSYPSCPQYTSLFILSPASTCSPLPGMSSPAPSLTLSGSWDRCVYEVRSRVTCILISIWLMSLDASTWGCHCPAGDSAGDDSAIDTDSIILPAWQILTDTYYPGVRLVIRSVSQTFHSLLQDVTALSLCHSFVTVSQLTQSQPCHSVTADTFTALSLCQLVLLSAISLYTKQDK